MKYDLENEKLFDRALNVNQIEYSNKLKIYLSGAILNKDIKEF